MRTTITPDESQELQELWREYSEATGRVLEIMRTEGTEGNALSRIVAEDRKAGCAIQRIKEIYGAN
jgi:hypothetical protein